MANRLPLTTSKLFYAKVRKTSPQNRSIPEEFHMRQFVLLLIAAFALGGQETPKPDMIPATVKHNPKSYTQTYDEVTVSCPAGYEGHWVDVDAGFEWPFGRGMQWGEPAAYTVCFRKEFMDKIRANPDLLRQKPSPPRPA